METSKKNEEIEALRAIAILFVLFHHNHGILPWGSSGGNWLNSHLGLYCGVDLFFCVSGFVIAKSVVHSFSSAPSERYWKEVKAFWTRRIYRLWPSAWLWLVIPLIFSLLIDRASLFGTPWANVSSGVAAMMNVANWHWYKCIANQFPDQSCGFSGTYWSLSLEEQFYLLFPLLFPLQKKSRRILLALLLFIQLPISRPHWSASILSFIRTDAMILGIAVAELSSLAEYKTFETKSLAHPWARRILTPLLLFALTICASPEGNDRVGIVSFSTGLVAIIAAMIVFIASYGKGYFIADSPLRKALATLGAHSYAIYLIHPLAFALTRELWIRISPPGAVFDGTYTIRFLVTGVALLALLVEFNYRYIETPLRDAGRRKSKEILAT